MTRLKALELVGFKSFADRTRFEFPEGITVVVGPNGSGKSNVVDAIKWVLGEQSVRNLRGKEMADVIFAGSVSRRPMNMAETSLIFDNSAGKLPLDSAEVSITRRVYRSGESEYLGNGETARLRAGRQTGGRVANGFEIFESSSPVQEPPRRLTVLSSRDESMLCWLPLEKIAEEFLKRLRASPDLRCAEQKQ